MNIDGLRIYLAGPMNSVGGNFNFPLFDHVARKLRDIGGQVYSPADHARDELGSLEDIQMLPKEVMKDARRQLMQDELNWICMHAQLVLMLPGWKQSPGARAEREVALAIGKKVIELPNIIMPIDSLDFSKLLTVEE
jgi:hypothetical protein